MIERERAREGGVERERENGEIFKEKIVRYLSRTRITLIGNRPNLAGFFF